jgi:hypothetical protein
MRCSWLGAGLGLGVEGVRAGFHAAFAVAGDPVVASVQDVGLAGVAAVEALGV